MYPQHTTALGAILTCSRAGLSSEKGAWKCNPAPSNVHLPELGIRCRDASVQLELSSPLRASTWQDRYLAAGWRGPPPAADHRSNALWPHSRCPSSVRRLSPPLLRHVKAHCEWLGEKARWEAIRTWAFSSPRLTAKEVRSW